jgi:hypothetical protein
MQGGFAFKQSDFGARVMWRQEGVLRFEIHSSARPLALGKLRAIGQKNENGHDLDRESDADKNGS